MRIHVEFDLVLPENTSPKHIDEWLQFELGCNGSMDTDNPLGHKGLEAKNLDWDER